MPSVITLATSPGMVAGTGRRVTAGGLADPAGFQATHSRRLAVAKAPDKVLWMFRCNRHTDMRLAPCAPAVVVAAPRNPAGAPARADVARHDGSTTLADEDKPFVGKDGQGVFQGRRRDALLAEQGAPALVADVVDHPKFAGG
jgi:hypothetical protein